MALKSAMNVRLPDELRVRLDRVANASKLKASDLVRMAVEEYCDAVEKRGTLTIPVDLSQKTAEPKPKKS